MNQNLWGKHAWFILHSLTLNYPLEPCQKDKNEIMDFLNAFGKILFCDVCKVHFNRNLRENPPRLDSRKDFFEWMVDVHNEVNGRTGKKAFTYPEALKYYEDQYQRKFTLDVPDNLTTNSYRLMRRMYCFWLTYWKHLVILTLLTVIGYLQRDELKKLYKNLKN